jgi:hypothetical protein
MARKPVRKNCREHDWIIGRFIGGVHNGQVFKFGVNIYCDYCLKKIKARYTEYPKAMLKRGVRKLK